MTITGSKRANKIIGGEEDNFIEGANKFIPIYSDEGNKNIVQQYTPR